MGIICREKYLGLRDSEKEQEGRANNTIKSLLNRPVLRVLKSRIKLKSHVAHRTEMKNAC
jgi:uncharacterized protein YggU (UPF0235/DUF167 family)